MKNICVTFIAILFLTMLVSCSSTSSNVHTTAPAASPAINSNNSSITPQTTNPSTITTGSSNAPNISSTAATAPTATAANPSTNTAADSSANTSVNPPTTAAVSTTPSSADSSSPVPSGSISGGIALIYNGKVSAEGCPEAVAVLAESMGMKVTYFDSPSKLPSLLNGAALCIFGGTEDNLNPLLKEFTPAVRKALSDWICAGGNYLGICGGGYIASKGWEERHGIVEGLGIVPVLSEAWIEDSNPRIITVSWGESKRTIYYQYGPTFLVDNNSDIEVISRYDNGKAAVLTAKLGKGLVIVSGPHPEADETWLEDDPPPVNAETWKPTRDLALSLFQKFFN